MELEYFARFSVKGKNVVVQLTLFIRDLCYFAPYRYSVVFFDSQYGRRQHPKRDNYSSFPREREATVIAFGWGVGKYTLIYKLYIGMLGNGYTVDFS